MNDSTLSFIKALYQKTKKNFSFKKIKCLRIRENEQMLIDGSIEVSGAFFIDGELEFISHQKKVCNEIKENDFLNSSFLFQEIFVEGVLEINCESQIFCDYRNFPKRHVKDYFLLRNEDYNLVSGSFLIEGIFDNHGELVII